MILFRKSLKNSIVIIFSFITLWITLTSCESYCDDNVGICLYANKYKFLLDLANYECKLNGSILLEIYDENYKEVTIKALQKFGLEKEGLLFGLVYTDGQFQWLSKREVNVQLDGMENFHSNRDCHFFLKLCQSHLSVESACGGGNPHAKFVCLKEINRSTTLHTTTNFNNNNQSPDNNYDQLNELKKKTTGISVAVVLTLIINIVVVAAIVLGICFLIKKVSIVIIFILITLWITLTICESYCDNNVGICLYANKYRLSCDIANYECKLNGSILLEIYDDKYKVVTIKALQKFRLDRGIQLLFGLVYEDGQLQWLSKREVSKLPFEELDGFQSNENCNFFLRMSQSQLRVDPACGKVNLISSFVCLKDINGSTTLPTTTNIIIPNLTPTNLINNNQLPDNKYDKWNELQKNIIGIGVGVVLSLILIIVVIGGVVGICINRRRKNSGMKSVTEKSMNQNYQCANTDYWEIEDEQVNTVYWEIKDYLELIEDEQVNTDYLEVIED